ncbi:glycerol-3-phosphate ABC transporter permease [Sutcliffiella cohnii]|uniref:Glycerol-3-phosphate ABC transporter permease n=1 Tax=Sutcliffiella cohnii TaxID=33932 RepID=A0A223KVI3_9BACI|nr:sugar ABC transporter permease [Sutcliffiella cohnii]AST93387.1 glycerol-3-phosphate ABC transporter permease [Sutcliffiella cohnii]
MEPNIAVESRKDLTAKTYRKRRERKLFWTGMLYLSPALFFLVVFLFYPMFKTLYFSFFQTAGAGIVQGFVGFDHYTRLFQSELFLGSLKSTFLFVLYTVPTGIVIALALAVIASEKLRGIGFFRIVFSSSLGISVAAGATIWLFFFHPTLGVLNNILGLLGIGSIKWLTSSSWALVSVAITTIWMNIGFNFIILLGGIQNISEELYESAKMDGAGYWRQLFSITLPLLSPTLFFVSVVTLINSFQTFGQIDILTGGGPSNSTNLIVYSIYREAFYNGRFGYASAQAIVLFLIILVFTIVQFKVGEKRVHYQ